jgi:hypothetical protein
MPRYITGPDGRTIHGVEELLNPDPRIARPSQDEPEPDEQPETDVGGTGEKRVWLVGKLGPWARVAA